MTHWGWYWKIKKKHTARTLCSKLISIDSFKLYNKRLKSGFIVKPLEIKAIPTPDCLKIIYRNRKNTSYTIPIEKQPCNYGGFRYFFKCPLCLQRMRILYLTQDSVFLCRKCLNLSYQSQRLRPANRYDYMSEKIKKIIQDKGGNLNLHKKPLSMHTSRYQKLSIRQIDYERKAHLAANQEIHAWYIN